MAGNSNSGNGLAFRLSDKQLEAKIKQFREEYGKGQHGMVTWDAFCAFLGYSPAIVRECYQRGKDTSKGRNAYYERAQMLEVFHTEVRAMMCQTAVKQQALAKHLLTINPLEPDPEEIGGDGAVLRIEFAGSAEEAEEMAT